MTRLPHSDKAVIAEAKITEYLLALAHPAGGPKAAFFRRFGFSASAWERLRDALLDHARSARTVSVSDTAFGRKYILDGPMRTPDGRQPSVRAIWFVRAGETVPRFVTAVPGVQR